MMKSEVSEAVMEARRILLLVLFMMTVTALLEMVVGAQNSINGGRWEMLRSSIGISSMHIQLLQNERIVTFDRTDAGPSNLTLPEGRQCPIISRKRDCYVHAVELELDTRNGLNVRPLTVLSDTWCSSGSMLPDGRLVQTGGYGDGEKVVRVLDPCPTCDWVEDYQGLISPRWYASNQVLPGGNVIVVGGRLQFSYEFIPKSPRPEDQRVFSLPFLEQTRYSSRIPNNLYPFTHLSPDGNLFVFANNRGILLDYVRNRVVRTYPVMPGNVARNYPSTGSSVLLPLDLSAGSTPEAEVFICGGTRPDSYDKARAGVFLRATMSCGRLRITARNPEWEMEEMPIRRVMGDMIMLPTGEVLIINGAANGTAGWRYARVPVHSPVIYRPAAEAATPSRFEILKAGKTPRLYHSTAHLLSDGRVVVAGGNPNHNYNFTVPFPTELSVEAFSPPYLTSGEPRPSISAIKPGMKLGYKQRFTVEFEVMKMKASQLGKVQLTMVAPSFTTHSFSMNQRLLNLALNGIRRMSAGNYEVVGDAPGSAAIAPPGYYQLFVVHEGVPSVGKWVHIE